MAVIVRKRDLVAKPLSMTETIPSATSAEINVDPEEIRQFDRIAGQWWDPTGPFKPLHDLAPARLGFIREAIDSAFATDPLRLRPLTGKTVLDVGCGGGLVSEPLARLGGSVTGIDLGEENIAVARRHAEMAGFAIT
ncbi:MAG: bifunctional 2-polyprenyl-6-hydroxyphenol methylase/3-demethylubiquinol 3-O-methyltransferase UbiG, partial [Pseudomonadota bacterium]